MLRKIVLILMVIALFAIGPVLADETERQVFKDCPRDADMQGHRDMYSVPEGTQCGQHWETHYAYEDVRLGMHFSGPSAGSLMPIGAAIEPAAVDPAARGKLCVQLFPDGTVLELIVPKGKGCTRNWSRYARRYYNGQVFVFPANYGMAINSLTPVGMQRAVDTIALAKAQSLAGK